MSETRVGEPKPDGPHKVRKVRRDRKDYGEIRYYPTKPGAPRLVIYWSKRRLDQFHTMTHGWLVEADVISAVKIHGVTHVGLVIEDGSRRLTPVGTFGMDGMARGVKREKSNTYVDPWGRRGAMCWHVPESCWAKQEAPPEILAINIAERMRVKRDRSKKTIEEVMSLK